MRKSFFQYLLFFQSKSCLLESTAAVIRQSAGYVYYFFDLWNRMFIPNGFPNPFIVNSRSSFLFSHWEFFELYVRSCPAMFFYFVKIFVTTKWRQNNFKSAFCSIVHAISTEVRAWRHFSLLVERVFLFIRVIKFLVTGDLPHSQKWPSLWNWLIY